MDGLCEAVPGHDRVAVWSDRGIEVPAGVRGTDGVADCERVTGSTPCDGDLHRVAIASQVLPHDERVPVRIDTQQRTRIAKLAQPRSEHWLDGSGVERADAQRHCLDMSGRAL